ncbi:hypothetical protein ZIOFF_036744 [Zingiber officinale]|uniref:cellulase n=1 Tax=Zingiber officinale TaxID=94328 RepID=A0A8J5GCC1_ZINOF|nr:hypothetical protein ZIOFF_036744 [Zingiber officinale]
MTSLINHTGSLVSGFYDVGDAIKFTFPLSFSMTLLSWSVIEYSAKYESTKELHHIKEIIRWGVDYLLKTLNSSADTTNNIVAEVEQVLVVICWARCSDLAAEVAAALAVASIVFKNDKANSYKLVHGVFTLWKFASRDIKHRTYILDNGMLPRTIRLV